MIQDIFSRLKQKAQQAFVGLNNQAKKELQSFDALRQNNINPIASSPVPARAIMTDLQPTLDSFFSKINTISPKITPATYLINKATGKGIGDILKSISYTIAPPYSAEEQAFFKKARSGEPLTQEDIRAGKSLSNEALTDIGLVSAGVKPLAKRAKSIQEILSKSLTTAGDNATRLPRVLPKGSFVAAGKDIVKTTRPIKTTHGLDMILDVVSSLKTPRSLSGAINEAGEKGARLLPPPLSPINEATQKVVEEATQQAAQTIKQAAKQPTQTKYGSPLNWYTRLTAQPLEKFKKLFGEAWETTAKPVFDGLQKAKGEMIDFKKNLVKQIQESIPFSAGSKESKLLQQFGEGVISYDELVKKVGQKNAEKIAKADKSIRKIYDDALAFVNAIREKEGLPLIERRKDYYRHMQESEGFSDFLESFVSGGASGKKGESLLKQRTTNKTMYDAIAGIKNWIDEASYLAYIDPQLKKLESLLSTTSKNNPPQQLVDELAAYIKQIKGEKEPFSSNPLINATMNIAESVGKTVRKNQVIGNVSSALSQVLNIPLAVADIGAGSSLRGVINFSKNFSDIEKIPFVKERTFRYPLQFARGSLEKGIAIGGKMLQAVDNATTRVIGSMYLEKGKRMGLSGKSLEEFVQNGLYSVMGGRGLGDASNLHYSRLGQFIAPFTVEVQAAVNKLGSFVDEGRIGSLVGYFVMAYGVNEAWKKLVGFAPLPDPIRAAIDMYKTATGETETEQPFLRVVGRAIGESLQFFPIAQNAIAFVYPILYDVAKDQDGNPILPSSRAIFGSEDPTRFGSMNLYLPRTDGGIEGVIKDAIFKYTPTGWGNQARKTIEGVLAGERGYTTSRSGRIVHEVPQDPLSRLKMAIFGQWATGESDKFFSDEGNRSLTKKQGELYRSLPKEDRSVFMQSVQNENKRRHILDILAKKNAKAETLPIPSDSADKKEKQAFKKAVDELLSRGITPTDEQLSFALFSKKSGSSPLIKEKIEVYQKALRYMKDEQLSEEQKDAILRAANIPKDLMEYYQLAVEKDAVKLERLLSEIMPIEDNKERLLSLMRHRRSIAGKQVLTDKMIAYLYDNEYIGKEEQELLKNLQYDEVKDRFYFRKSFSSKWGQGGSSQTKEQKLALKAVEKQYLKILNLANKAARLSRKKQASRSIRQAAQIYEKSNKLIQDILAKKPKFASISM